MESFLSDYYPPNSGPAPTINIGTVTTVDFNEGATVVNSGNEQHAIFNFEIPRGESFDIIFPWKIMTRATENEEYEEGSEDQQHYYEYKIACCGKLFQDFSTYAEYSVNGMSTWISLNSNGESGKPSSKYIILNAEVANGIVTEANIEINEELPEKIVFNSGEQSEFNYVIGQAIQGDDGLGFGIKQYAFHNLTVIDLCADGASVIYPIAT